MTTRAKPPGRGLDPTQALSRTYEAMLEDLSALRRTANDAATDAKRAELAVAQIAQQILKMNEYRDRAAKEGRQDLVAQAETRARGLEQTQQHLETSFREQKRQSDRLSKILLESQSAVEDFRGRRASAVALGRRAVTPRELDDLTASVNKFDAGSLALNELINLD